MRLAQFITTQMEAILAEWEAFAASQLPAGVTMNSLALREHVKPILQAVAIDIMTAQTEKEQARKSMGRAFHAANALAMTAQVHAVLRLKNGFDINQMVAEYRALRASVLRLWAQVTKPSALVSRQAYKA